METINFKVDVEKAGIRIDRYLADVCLDFSRSYLQKLLKDQMVSVNGKVVKANYKTRAGDEVALQVPDMQPLDIKPEEIPLDILYEDEWLMVVNKPKDMVVHPSAGHMEGTLVNAVMAHCGEHLSGSMAFCAPESCTGSTRTQQGHFLSARRTEPTETLQSSSRSTVSNEDTVLSCRGTSKKMRELLMLR